MEEYIVVKDEARGEDIRCKRCENGTLIHVSGFPAESFRIYKQQDLKTTKGRN